MNKLWVKTCLNRCIRDSTLKWNFDFRKEQPLVGRFEWIAANNTLDEKHVLVLSKDVGCRSDVDSIVEVTRTSACRRLNF